MRLMAGTVAAVEGSERPLAAAASRHGGLTHFAKGPVISHAQPCLVRQGCLPKVTIGRDIGSSDIGSQANPAALPAITWIEEISIAGTNVKGVAQT